MCISPVLVHSAVCCSRLLICLNNTDSKLYLCSEDPRARLQAPQQQAHPVLSGAQVRNAATRQRVIIGYKLFRVCGSSTRTDVGGRASAHVISADAGAVARLEAAQCDGVDVHAPVAHRLQEHPRADHVLELRADHPHTLRASIPSTQASHPPGLGAAPPYISNHVPATYHSGCAEQFYPQSFFHNSQTCRRQLAT